MELESADAVVATKPPRFGDGILLVRVDARERDQDIGVRGRHGGDLLVADGGPPSDGLRVDGEDDRHHLSLPVVRRHVGGGRRPSFAEVLLRGVAPLGPESVLTCLADLGMRVDVDGDDVLEVDAHRSSASPSLITDLPSPFTHSKP